jgi:hypothetical protein
LFSTTWDLTSILGLREIRSVCKAGSKEVNLELNSFCISLRPKIRFKRFAPVFAPNWHFLEVDSDSGLRAVPRAISPIFSPKKVLDTHRHPCYRPFRFETERIRVSEINRIANEYLRSLGKDVPAVEDSSPKTFQVKPVEETVAPPDLRQVTVTRALGAPYNLPDKAKLPEGELQGLWAYAERQQHPAYTEITPAERWDAINFPPAAQTPEPEQAKTAWRIWPTGSEVRAAILIGALILSILVLVVLRFS